MKKFIHDEKEVKVFVSLVVIAGLIIGLFSLIFNWMNPMPVPPPCPPGSNNCSIQVITLGTSNTPTTNNDLSYTVNIQSTSTAFKKYIASYPSTKDFIPKTDWEKEFSQPFSGCVIASTSVPISNVESNLKDENQILIFNYALCPYNSPSFYSFGGPNEISYIWNSEDPGVDFSRGTEAFKYWILSKNQNPEDFISGLAKSYPTELERSHCKVSTLGKNAGGETVYTMRPDGYYKEYLASKGYEWMGSCSPYYGSFKKIGNILVYYYQGQDVHIFDPDSFKVENVDVPKIQP